jgi:subtilisin family serine protease
MTRAQDRRFLPASPQPARRSVRLALEPLEDRTLPAAFVPHEILVQFAQETTAATRSAMRVWAQSAMQATLAEQIHTEAMEQTGAGVLERWTLPSSLGVLDALRRMPVTTAIEFAEPNWIHTTQDVSNDPYYMTGSRLWGTYSDDLPAAMGPTGTTNAYGSGVEKVWNAGFTGSNNVYVGVIDEGVQWSHPDLINNMWLNSFDPVDGVDNDGNGYVDDTRGWDFDRNNNTVYDGTMDNHGTHVAGTIGAVGGNGIGTAGVNWHVTMIPAKFLGVTGGSSVNAIKAVDYLTDLKTRHGLNIVATNNSWGGGNYSSALEAAITRGANAGILFVAAAGNNNRNNDTSPYFASNYSTLAGAGYEAVISVAALTDTGARATYSNYGATTVDLGAPGSGIWSTVPTDSYASYNGTSMAAPHVTGAIALYASVHPTATAQEIRQAILGSVTPTASLAGKTMTGGRLNIWNALSSASSQATLSINDVSVTEGDSGTKTATFTVTLAGSSSQPVQVNYSTSNGTATVTGNDYVATSGTLIFTPGQTTKTIAVTVKGDTAPEGSETFSVNLASPTNAIITRGTGVGTIIDDDTRELRVNDVSVTEGNNGAATAVFTVSLSSPSAQTVLVTYQTADGTATAASGDYVSRSGFLQFAPGQITQTVAVTVNGDTMDELDETFSVILSNPANAVIADGTGTGTIVSDDVSAPPGVTISDAGFVEPDIGSKTMYFTVTLSKVSTLNVTLNYTTVDGTATTANGDYLKTTGTLVIPAGSLTATIGIKVYGDLRDEQNETFFLQLTSAINATLVDPLAIGTITDDD